MPADAGAAAPEALTFVYSATDALGNVGTTLPADTEYQIYQGDLPPLAVPIGVNAEALPDGEVRISWLAVDGALEYWLYRQAPGETQLTQHMRLGNQTEYTDNAGDGIYTYALTSIRTANTQETQSALSDSFQVQADSIPPAVPQGLSLQLLGQGVQAQWSEVLDADLAGYRLYRSDSTPILDTSVLTALVEVPAGSLSVVDSAPAEGFIYYIVTAVDTAGNESGPSDTMSENFHLLPVNDFVVQQIESGNPTLTWTATNTATHFKVYAGTGAAAVDLTPTLITQNTYTDSVFNGQRQLYTVVPYDSQATEGPARSLLLPDITIELPENDASGALIRRGVMNAFPVSVVNNEAVILENVYLEASYAGHTARTGAQTIDPGMVADFSVVLGGFADLPDYGPVDITLVYEPNQGEQARITRGQSYDVADGALPLQIIADELTRGSDGDVRFAITNTGEATVELILANDSGSQTGEIEARLLDSFDNVLSVASIKQTVGDGVINLSSGETIARIAPGETFTGGPIALPIPSGAPDDVRISVQIASYHTGVGQAGASSIPGSTASADFVLADTSYYGEVVNVAPSLSYGNEPVVITGRAVDRANGASVPGVPMRVVLRTGSHERNQVIFTDANGEFSYSFQPGSGEAGVYDVSALHPDRTERPVHETFTIQHQSVSPSGYDILLAPGLTYTAEFQFSPGVVDASNVELIYLASDQTGGVFPAGVNVVPASAQSVSAGATGTIAADISIDASAAPRSDIVLRMQSTERTSPPIALLSIRIDKTVAEPAVQFTPPRLDTGTPHDQSVIETIVMENVGVAPLNDVAIQLQLPGGGTPPDWASLLTADAIDSLAVGETADITLGFAPKATVLDGTYDFELIITASNATVAPYPVRVGVTQSGFGGVIIRLSDIYTQYIPDDAQPGFVPEQGYEGGEIELVNERIPGISFSGVSDINGEWSQSDIPAGTYKYRVSGEDHQEERGRIEIRPGVTVSKEIFVDYSLITVTWEVNEISILDRYQIVLEATFQTNVPAAVVVAEPTTVVLDGMSPGDVLYGEITLTNHGLVRADDLRFNLPSSDRYFQYDLLGTVPDRLGPGQSVVLPYRVVSLQSVEASDATATGGGCGGYTQCTEGECGYECANGTDASLGINPTCLYGIDQYHGL